MKKGKALVTGGAGFIGFTISKILVKRGFNVTIVDNLSRPDSKVLWPEFEGFAKKTGSRLLTRDLCEPQSFLRLGNFELVFKKTAPLSRNELARRLEAADIETRPFFAGSLPDQPALKGLKHRIVGDLPHARYLRDQALFSAATLGFYELKSDGSPKLFSPG